MAHRVLAVILFVFGITPAGAAQERPAAPPPAIPPTGRIAGSVVNAETGRPVRLADIVLTSSGGERKATTDDSGGFSFDRLPAGSYSFLTSKPGFLDSHYGQGRPGTDTSGRRITLKDREEITRLVVPLSQGGSISGVVRDDHGDPVFHANVRVSRWVMRGGKRTLQGIGSTETDERGMFRVGLLPSRQYVVSAVPPDQGSDDNTPPQGVAPVFYPSSLSVGSAETIPLGVGEHKANVDLVMPVVKWSKVTGIVVDSTGRPVPEFPVSLVDQSSGMWLEQGTLTEPDGRFSFLRVVPGSYVVRAGARGLKKFSIEFASNDADFKGEIVASLEVLRTMERKIQGDINVTEHVFHKGGDDAAERARESGSVDVSVSGDAAPDVVLRLDPPRDVAGRVAFEGAGRRPAANIDIALRPVDDGPGGEARVAADGSFTVKDVAPGRYFVEVIWPGSPWSLASATSAGVEALDFQLEVPRDRDVRDLTLTFRDRAAELSGSVTDASTQPVTDRRVIIFPSDERLWATATDRIQATALTETGRFTFGELRPGAYWLGVVADVESDEWLLPDFLRQLIGASVPIIIADGEKKTQDLRVK
jgi:Carboxypeptidase regulatory-like domain